MKRLICLAALWAVMGLPLAAQAEETVSTYEQFSQRYAENLSFINQNVGGYLLPLTFTQEWDEQGRLVYQAGNEMLSASVRLDGAATNVEQCQITLTAPLDMAYGDSQYELFEEAGYHSYALLMAMSAQAEPASRYALVESVNDGLALSDTYTQTLDAYTLTCWRLEQSVTLQLSLGVGQMENKEGGLQG